MKHFLKQHAGACFLAAFAAVGLAFGLGYYFVVGCALGTCPITSNPVASALYGGVMGFLLGVYPASAALGRRAGKHEWF